MKPCQLYVTGLNGAIGKAISAESLIHTFMPIKRLGADYDFIAAPRHPACLLHLASPTPFNSLLDEEHVNIYIAGFKRLVTQFNEMGLRPFVIFASSLSVYRKNNETLIIDENSPITQVDPYGLLKLATEYCCSMLYNNGLIQEYIILRLPAVLAPKSINFVTSLAYTLYNKKDVTVTGDSSYYNACIDAISLARIIDTIVIQRIYTCRPVNIGSINSMKMSDLVDFLQLELGVNVPVMWSKKGSWVGSNSPYTLDLTVASRCCLPLPTLESSLSNLCLLIEKEYFNTV